ncbi:MAG TPA: HAD-IIIA family hydrolase [Limnobacter sp.]|nr:HAD-IIIA family hydrolase [Limnobacter sp.]
MINSATDGITTKTTAAEAAGQLKLMGFDVDGTLTDGGLYFGNEGEVMKRFSVFDGQGLRLLMDHGVKVVWITARSSTIVEKRARDLGIHRLVQGCKTKLQAMDEIRQSFDLQWSECGFFGDDWPDYPVLQQVALAATTQHSPQPMIAAANWINTRAPGNGAVRELCDFILAHQPGYINPWTSK